jgi:hypothetical protein
MPMKLIWPALSAAVILAPPAADYWFRTTSAAMPGSSGTLSSGIEETLAGKDSNGKQRCEPGYAFMLLGDFAVCVPFKLPEN